MSRTNCCHFYANIKYLIKLIKLSQYNLLNFNSFDFVQFKSARVSNTLYNLLVVCSFLIFSSLFIYNTVLELV